MIRYFFYADSTGYGLSALAYISCLKQLGFHVWPRPMLWNKQKQRYTIYLDFDNAESLLFQNLQHCFDNQAERNKFYQSILQPVKYQINILHTTPNLWPGLGVSGQINIGYTVWDTDRLPANWTRNINLMNLVMVPSTFNKTMFERSGVTIPIAVIPHILNKPQTVTVNDQPEPGKIFGVPDDTFIFYSINDWVPRKALWKLVNVYLQTFNRSDKVLLLLKTSPDGPRNQYDRKSHPTKRLVDEIVLNYKNAAPIRIINRKVSQSDINLIHIAGDCFVNLSFGESWAMSLIEAAVNGNIVLATAWGGHLDYLSDLPKSMIEYRLVPAVDHFHLNESGHRWAAVNEQQAGEKMREIYDNKYKFKAYAISHSQKLQQQYCSQKIGRDMAELINKISKFDAFA